MTRYTALLLAPVLAAAALGLALGWWLEPLSGDLTRLGWWPERRFGWMGEEQQFDPPLAMAGGLARGADILVIGDSFSARQPLSQTPAGGYWPNWLARDTGLKVAVIDSYRITMAELVEHLPRLQPPPLAVVLQVVERYAPQRHGGTRMACAEPAPPRPRTASIKPIRRDPAGYRRAVYPSLADPPIGYALQYLWRDGLRRAGLARETEVAVLALDRGGLFSSRDDRHMLTHRDELGKPPPEDPVWRAAACDLLAWQGRVQAAAPTLFLAMVAPDRLTAYSEALADPVLRRRNGIAAMAAETRLHLPRLDLAFQAAAAAGEVDIYLPNDTHWSARGHALAAQVVGQELQRRGALRPVDSRASQSSVR